MIAKVLLGVLFVGLAACSLSDVEVSPSSTSPTVQVDKRQDSFTIEVESVWEKEPQPHEFFRDGRPNDLYTLRYSNNKEACKKLVSNLNQAGKYNQERGSIVHQSDILLKSDISVDWLKLGSTTRPVDYVEVDIDNDGKIDRVIREMNLLGDSLALTALSYSWVGFVQENPNDTYLTNEMMDKVVNEYKARKDDYKEKDLSTFGPLIKVDNAHVKFGDRSLPQDDHRLTRFGQFKEVVTIDDTTYLLVGGSLDQKLIKNSGNKPVYLLDLQSDQTLNLVCELHPKYKHTPNLR